MPLPPGKGCRAQGWSFHNVPYANQIRRWMRSIWYVEQSSARYLLIVALETDPAFIPRDPARLGRRPSRRQFSGKSLVFEP